MKTLVGSTAMSRYIPGVREPSDLDHYSPDKVKGEDNFYDPRLEQWVWGDIATLDELYTIKISHSFWQLRNGSWNKHVYDIELMKNHGAKFIPELYDILYPIWEDLHGKKSVNLNTTADIFFNSNVTRLYEHDSLHQSVKYHDEPMFNLILMPGHDVMVSQQKFEALTDQQKLELVHEELFVIALERVLIPNNYVGNPRTAYTWALRQMITSLSKGWFPLWIMLNYDVVRKLPFNYLRLHKTNQKRLVLL